ncbi:hypothetical protein QYE76_034647 [Lolium multiflorum]|uniref:Peptidase A2 domain-containing protein n=1 Tax=Lolium multiflorum TaxID=4521 RepID=A0AAD8R006_LOLMU|nr:hypothetical protein QYE76_034647 [Lolium multiflorum]
MERKIGITDQGGAPMDSAILKSEECRPRNLEEAEAQYLYTLSAARSGRENPANSGDEGAPAKEKFRAPSDEEVSVAQFDCGPRPVIFEKPQDRSYRHLKALYLKGYINRQPISKMLVDTGAAVKIMPYSMLRRLGHSSDDLIKTNITLSDFNGQAAKGVLNVELTVGRKTIPTAFFIVDSKSNYAVLLGRDWIHANCCIPSTMHQCIIQWDGDEVEVVQADDSIEISLAAMSVWEADDQEPLSGISLEGCERIEASKNGVFKVSSASTNMQFRLMVSPTKEHVSSQTKRTVDEEAIGYGIFKAWLMAWSALLLKVVAIKVGESIRKHLHQGCISLPKTMSQSNQPGAGLERKKFAG